jgi:TetR/AcrR family transcriptional regulator, tetracycline repressor protein
MSSDAFDLDADEIVTAAVDIFLESGLDAVSMRRVSNRLGVSPVPLYSRIGNKDALIDAIADRLLEDVAPKPRSSESWTAYAARWARALRHRLRVASDSRLIVARDRDAYVEASRPLIEVMRRDGLSPDAAVQACRLIMWATVGFGAVEVRGHPLRRRRPRGRRPARPGGDPTGVDRAEADVLFDMNIRYLLDGLQRDLGEVSGG